MKKIIYKFFSPSSTLSYGTNTKKSRRTKKFEDLVFEQMQASGIKRKMMAATLCLLISAPQLCQLKAYAQILEQPATVNTVPNNVQLQDFSASTVAGITGSPGSVMITGSDKLPSSSSTDSQSGGGPNAPSVPQAPGLATVDATVGLIPHVEGVPLTPNVPDLVVVAPAAAPADSVNVASIPVTDSSASTSSVTVTTTESVPSEITSAPVVANTTSSTADVSGTASLTSSSNSFGATMASQASLTNGDGLLFSNGLGLDLSSGSNVIAAPINIPVTIIVGGTVDASGVVSGGVTQTIQPGQMVTASQYVALIQVVQTGNQSIVLGTDGSSSSGSFSLLANQTDALSSLVLPTNVVLYGVGFNSADPLVVSGATNIAGSLFTLHSSNSLTDSFLNFGNLTVSGLLSGSAPTSILGAALPDSSFLSSSALSINSLGSIFNLGTISSPGSLTLTAVNDIVNSGLTSGTSVVLNAGQTIANSGTIFASAGNINMNSMAGNFVNSGFVSASMGSVNVNTSTPTLASNINFDNLGGKLSARDDINFRESSFDQKANLYVSGGDLYSSQVNLYGGRGLVDLNVGELSGVVNTTGHDIHLLASTENFQIGNVTATGDPLLGNTAGNFTLVGAITGAPLTVIARGDILSQAGSSLNSAGGQMFLASGVNFAGAIPGGGTITGPASPDGGQIDLRNVSSITTGGGNFVAVAYDGQGVDSGRIRLAPAVTLTTNGGNVTMIGADRNAAGLNAIEVGTINTTGGAVGSGSITLAAADLPTSVNVVVDAAGNATGLNQFTVGTPLDRNILVTGDLRTNGGAINLTAGNGNSNGTILIQGAGGINTTPTSAGSGGNVTISQGTTAGPFVIGGATNNGVVAGTGIIANANTNGDGGTISVTNSGTGGITVNNPTTSLSALSAGNGNGGSYLLNATNGPLSINGAGAINANGSGTGSGGTISLLGQTVTPTGLINLNANSGGPAGNAGTVIVKSTSASNSIVVANSGNAFNITAAGTNGTVKVTAGQNLTVNTAGLVVTSPSGNGSTVELVAGSGGPGTLNLTGAINVSGGGGTGNGGKILLQSNSASNLAIGGAGSLLANGANGGIVEVVNLGTGGISIPNIGSISASATNGNGGKITVDATRGPVAGNVTLAAGTYNANGAGANGNGGEVCIFGADVTSSGFVNLQANGAGTGNGGKVCVVETGASGVTISNAGAGNFSLTAQGGAAGGNGGEAIARSGGNLTVSNVAGFNVAPQAGNSNGGIIRAEAGLGPTTGNLFVNGNIAAAGLGTGNGGTVELTSDSATTFAIGAGATTNGVNGQISANGGGNAGIIRVVNNGTGGITLNAIADATVSGPGGNGELTFSSPGGPISIPTGTVDVGGAVGGKININGSTLVSPGVGPLTLSANGATGSGGSVNVTTTSNASNMTVGGGGDDSLVISATGTTDGGSATVVAGGNLTVTNDLPSLNVAGTNGNGGNITLTAGNGGPGNLFVNRSLDVSATSAAGNGGQIRLQTNSGSTFNIGAGSASPGVNGTLTANNGAAGGNGGTVSVVNTGNGGININDTANISIGNANTVNGGTINLDATGGTLTIPVTAGNFTLNAHGNSNGGNICLNGNTIAVPGPRSLVLDVSGGTAAGNRAGLAKITQGSGNLNIGTGAGDLQINNTGSGGAADCVSTFNVDILTPGNINLDPAAIAVATNPNGDGLAVRLRSTAGNVFITNTLDVSGNAGTSGNGGCILVETNTSNNFIVGSGGVVPNGVNGSLIANSGTAGGAGGTIRIVENGTGGITVANTANISVNAVNGAGGNVFLNASGSGSTGDITINNGLTISANAGGGNFTGGNITLIGDRVVTPGGAAVNLNATGSGTGNGGVVSVTTNSATAGDINVGSAGGQLAINVTSPGGGNGGTINLDAARSLIADASQLQANGVAGNGAGGTINLLSGRGGNSASALQVTGTPNANGFGNGAGGTINVKVLQEAGETFVMGGNPGGANHFIGDGVNAALTARSNGTGAGGNITIQNISAGNPLNITWFNNPAAAVIDAGSTSGVLGAVNFKTAGGNTPAGGESINVAIAPTLPPPAGNTPPPSNIGDIKGAITAIGQSVFIQTEANNSRQDVQLAKATNGTVTLYSRVGAGSTVAIGEGRRAEATQDVNICAHIIDVNGTVQSTGGNIGFCSLDNLTLKGDAGTINTNGGTVIAQVMSPGGTLTVDNNWTVNTNGGNVSLDSCNDATNSIVVNADRTMKFNGGGSATISSPNLILNNNSGFVATGANTSLNVDSCGDFNLTVTTNGTATLASSGAGSTLSIGSHGTAVNKDISFNGAGTLNLDAGGGTIQIGARNGTCNPNITVGTGVTLAARNNQALNVHTQHLTMQSNSNITNSAANSPINVDNLNCGGPLTITTGGTAGASPNITTNNGNVSFSNVTNGQNVTFDAIAAGNQLNVFAGTGGVATTVNNAAINIATGTTLNTRSGTSDTQRTLFQANNGTFDSQGTVIAHDSTGTGAGRIDIRSTGTLDVPRLGTLTVDPVTGNGGTINVISTGALTMGTGAAVGNTISANGVGNGNGGNVTVCGSTVAFNYGASPLVLNANAAGTGNGGSIFVCATDPVNGNVTTGGGTGNIQLNARGGATNGNGGTATINAANNLILTGAGGAIDVSAIGANGNGGTIDLTASSGSGSGQLTLSGGTSLNANGVGTGNGGTVKLTSNSSQLLTVNQSVNVNAGATSGNGGQILVQNHGNGAANGGISVTTVMAANATGNGNGGTVRLDACPPAGVAGDITISTSTFSANGAGNGNGGLIEAKGARILSGAPGAVSMTANAGTVGTGGTVNLVAKAADGDINLANGVGGFTASAQGGTTSGNGGTVTATAGRNISVGAGAGAINVSPLGGNSNGGNITLSAGNSAPGIVTVGSGLSADGVGSGSGGNILVEYNDPTANNANRFVVGGVAGASGGINGNVTANGGASGAGGNITFRNRDGVTGNDRDLFQDLQGTVSAGGSAGLGNITYNQDNASNTLVDVRGPVGQGALIGRVNARENDVFINPQAANTTLTAGTVLARNGNAELVVNCNDNSQIVVPVGSSVISNTGEARLMGRTINNSGTIQGQTNVRLTQDTLINSGIVNAVTGDVIINPCFAGNALNVTVNAGSQLNANNGNIRFSNTNGGGTISVTGAGNVGTNPNGFISFGDGVTPNTVTMNVNQAVGAVTGIGTTVTVQTATGNLNVGPFTSSGTTVFTANGANADISTTGAINSGAGNLTLQAVGPGNSRVLINNNVTSTGALTLSSGTGGLSVVGLQATGITVTGGTVSVTTPQLFVNTNSTLTASTGDLDVQGNGAGVSLLSISLANGAVLSSQNADVGFNRTTAGRIGMLSGALGTIRAGGATPQVFLNGGNGSNTVGINVNNIIGCVEGSGTTYSVVVANGDLNVGLTNTSFATTVRTNGAGSDIITCGNITSTNGPVTMQAGTGADADVKLNNNVSSGGALNIISSGGANSDVTVATGVTISGATTTVTTPSLVVDGTGIVRSTGTGADLQITSNAPGNVLNVALNGPTATLQSNTGNVNFNTPGAQGAITVTGGPANGVITANGGNGNVNLNGGLTNAVNVNVNQINGCIAGTGTPFNVTVAQASVLGDVRFGPITSNGDLNLTSPANLMVCDDLRSNGGSINLTSGGGAANQIGFAANADLFANNNVILTTPNLNLTGGNNTINATTGDVTIQSNTAGNALAVTMGAGSQINAATAGTGDIFFNPTTPGNINVTGGSANGLLNAGNTVSYGGGTVATNVSQINGCVVSNGAGVTTATVTTATGDLNVGPFTSSGSTSFTANGVGADLITCGSINSGAGSLTLQAGTGADADVKLNHNIITTGTLAINSGNGAGSDVTLATGVTVSGGTTSITTPQLVAGASSTLRASTGDLDVQSNGAGQALIVNLASGSTLVSTNSDVGFNRTTAGAITMTGGLGTLQSGGATPQVIFNGGNGANAVNVDVNNIIGCAEGSGSTYSILTQTGDLNVGLTNTSGATSVRTNGVGADIITCGNITSTNGPVTMQAGSGADADVKLNNNVSSGGALNITSSGGANSDVTVATGVTVSGATTTVTTPSLVVDGTGIVRSTGAGADLQITSNAPGNVLNVALNGPTATLQSNTGNVNFNTPGAQGQITVTGGPANGVITANAGNGNVNLNGGLANAVNVNVNQINGCITGTGTPFNVTVAQASVLGDVRFGPVTSNGDLNFTSPANLLICNALTSNAGSITLTSGTSPAHAIQQAVGATVTANQSVNLNSSNIQVNNSFIAQNGDVNIKGNAPGNAVNITMGTPGALIQANVGNVVFNSVANPGAVTVVGGPANGTISANGGNGNIVVNSGTNDVVMQLLQAQGCVTGVARNVTLATGTGDIKVGPLTTSGLVDVQANGAGADILTCGDINSNGSISLVTNGGAGANVVVSNNLIATGSLTLSSGSGAGSNVSIANGITAQAGTNATVNTPQLNLGTNSQLIGVAGPVLVASNAPGNSLNIVTGNGSQISSGNGITFNNPGAASEGPISISGTGTINSGAPANLVTYNVGPNNLAVTVNQIIGCNTINGVGGNPTSVNMSTQVGSIDFCAPINTSNPAGNGGPITITANGGAVNLGGNDVNASGGGATGNGGVINISGAGGINNGGNIISNGSATGTGNGGPITLTAPGNNNITVSTIQSNGGTTGGNGGNITTNSSNLSVTGVGPGGASISANGPAGSGGTVSITTTSTNPFVAGNPFPNGTASGISANGGAGNGGSVMIASNGASVNPGVTVSANGTGNGGVVTFDANDPTNPFPTFSLGGNVSATGGTPGTGVIGIGVGPVQGMVLNVPGGGMLNAGQQVTIGNIDPVTGLAGGPPAGLLFISPSPTGPFPQGPFQAPNVVINGTVFVPPPPNPTPVGSGTTGGGGAAFNLGAFLAALGLNQNDALLGLRIPVDLTRVFSRGKLNSDLNDEDENEEIAMQKNLGKACGFIEGSRTYASYFNADEITRLSNEKVQISADSTGSKVTLTEGNVLFAPDKAITVQTEKGTIHIPKDSIVFVMVEDGDLAVFDLHQTSQNGVQVVSDKKLITLDPGRLLVLTSEPTRDFERVINRCRCIGYRNPKEEDINEDIRAFGMDFSLPSITSNVIPLRQMLSSSTGADKIAMEKILKNSALLMELTANAGPFKDGNN